MAPVDTGDFLLDEDDDDFFVEYNPHPYRGGYDLAATFGTPLPPSANTCYPVSSSAVTNAPTVPSLPKPTPEPEDPPPEEPHGVEEAPREPVYESPEVFPNGAATEGKVRRRGGWRGRGFWKKCVRAVDYLLLMGYKDPYLEQRIGMDSYVVPVCANGKECGEDALAVEVESPPPSVGRVEPHHGSEKLVQSNDLSWHSNYRDDASTYSQCMSNLYYMPSFAQSYGRPGVLDKPYWFPNFSYTESHRVEEFQHEPLLTYDVEHEISGQPFHCYHHQCYKQPLTVQVESPGPVSSQRLEYYENFSTYCGKSDGHIFETPAYAYNIQSYASISDVPIEPFRPSWPQNWGLYDTNTDGDPLENDAHSLISGEYGGMGSLFVSPFYPTEIETFKRTPSDEHASFQHNLSYQNVPMDDVSLITQPVRKKVLGNINGSYHQCASGYTMNLKIIYLFSVYAVKLMIINMVANINCLCAVRCSDSY
ncbi:hypothetical protein HU200_017828 [Digitaria exilis]|uniref:Uncharacterized protein n=1 Tax=Digitaria exilis TaxID=1010633 RepID=A0A835KEM9_9POAL|nr:hypothetical protein HU200_017828 [Digitaria exilis]